MAHFPIILLHAANNNCKGKSNTDICSVFAYRNFVEDRREMIEGNNNDINNDNNNNSSA